MRALLVVGLLPLLAACSTMTPSRSSAPSALPVASADSDLTGRWTGKWIGTGLFESPREDAVLLDFKQVGYAGYGRLVIDGSTAAESVPWDVRREGLSGVRVAAKINGPEVRVTHEAGARLFSADLTRIDEDRMVGDVRGTAPGVRLLLTRVRKADPPQARILPAPPEPDASALTELLPTQEAPAGDPDPVQIASVMPSEEPQVQEATERPRIEEYVPATDLKPVHFDFDSAKLRPDALDALATNAEWLKEHQDLQVMIEGHCDERGTTEYNQALGDRRAQSVKESLTASGIEADRLATISYGKERPVCTESTEECHKLNRHVEFRIKSR